MFNMVCLFKILIHRVCREKTSVNIALKEPNEFYFCYTLM